MSSSSKCLEGLELQLAEVDMLTSMYPNPGEFELDDPVAVELVRAVVNRNLELESLDTRIGFTIKVSCEEKNKKLTVVLVCLLPHEYPFVKPQIFTRASDMSRERHKELREDLQKQLESLQEDELVVGMMVEWLQERLYQELPFLGTNNKVKKTEVGSGSKKITDSGRDTITRLWVYSHHIYSKIKRRDIQEWGQELGLHGFSLPGKPGVICAEGFTCDVDEFWYRIRRMTWKKICIKEQEVDPSPSSGDLRDGCKFDSFSELVLNARGGKGREYHMDLGQFNTYLQEHGSGHIFNLFFGVDGRQADNDDG
ncbi:RWD domain-containing protein 2B [Aplysia californica]|uniref:RWD domain-containing protein 2B n=1 Tax=Aplysia californica TaxID=6500 RepID=A0ABM1W046_APLCA|nr:RWD domain-containing protein 2B [Aplysia californica]XP_035828037.1 RWD domain-containing protein 2B [Aplysia californica]XP_035828039.1 RWD domain-containing protein 2B [Aplysia californica]